MKKLIGIAGLAAALIALPSFLQAADPKPTDAPKTERKARGMPLNGKVSAVERTAKTITVGETEKARVLQVTSESKIYKNNKPATFDDVLVGEQIGAYVRPNAEGKLEVVTLKTGLASRPAKAKPDEKKSPN